MPAAAGLQDDHCLIVGCRVVMAESYKTTAAPDGILSSREDRAAACHGTAWHVEVAGAGIAIPAR